MCPDSNISNNGMNDVKAPSGEINDGIVRIRYTRPLNTGKHCKRWEMLFVVKVI